MTPDTRYVPASVVLEFGTAIFERLGLPQPHAVTVAECLVKANLRGLDSHRGMRIPIYAKRLRLGLVNPHPSLALSRVASSAPHLDGDDGMGLVVGIRAMAEAVAIARETGIGMVGVRRSTHYGTAAFKQRMDTMIDRLKASEPAAGVNEALMPGEPEVRHETERLRTGLPLTAEVLASLETEARQLGVALPPLSPTPLG